MNYVIITPMKNEGCFIERTIRSVCSQTVKPVCWMIVDDGSTDNSPEIVKKYKNNFSFIEYIKLSDMYLSEYSSRIAHIVNFGTRILEKKNILYEVIVKLDADVSFECDFFNNIMDALKNNPSIGIASGRLKENGIAEKKTFFNNTRGAVKVYRKECWQSIHGIFQSRGWDVMDDVSARQKGWKTQVLECGFEHLKKEGLRTGYLKKHLETGLFNGRVPFNPVYLSVKYASQFIKNPFSIGLYVQLFGYFKARFIQRQRIFPEEVSNYLRTEQREKIIGLFRRRCKNVRN